MLATPAGTRRFYRELWRLERDAEPPSSLDDGRPLPPFLCRRLAFGEPVVDLDASWPEAMAGAPDAVVERFGPGLHWCTARISPALFDILPVPGHAVAETTAERRAWLDGALDRLVGVGAGAAAFVCDFIGTLVWFETGPRTLTSSSFPELPHLTAVSDRALRILLPNTLLAEPSTWALAEDLMHEALHQQLSATILERDVFTEDYASDQGPQIPIFWRDEVWTFDRAVHALFVYTGLVDLRRQALHAGVLADETQNVEQALEQALPAMAHLQEQVGENTRFLTDDGRALLATFVAPALD